MYDRIHPGVEEWKKQTSAFDRVQSISNTLSQPRSASYIADEAHVAENTARTHLERLVSLNVLLESDQKEPPSILQTLSTSECKRSAIS